MAENFLKKYLEKIFLLQEPKRFENFGPTANVFLYIICIKLTFNFRSFIMIILTSILIYENFFLYSQETSHEKNVGYNFKLVF